MKLIIIFMLAIVGCSKNKRVVTATINPNGTVTERVVTTNSDGEVLSDIERVKKDPNAVMERPKQFYDGGYVSGCGYMADDGECYPSGYTYYYRGRPYRDGLPYTGSLLGAMAVGYYYGSAGPGFGRSGMVHTTVVNNNTTVVKGGSKRYNTLYKKKAKLRRKLAKQNKQLKANKKKLAKQQKQLNKPKKKSFFSRFKSNSKKTTKSRSFSSGSRKMKPTSRGNTRSNVSKMRSKIRRVKTRRRK